MNAGAKVIVPDTTLYTGPLAEKFNVPLGKDWKHIEALLLDMMDEFNGVNQNQEALFDMAS